MLTQKWMHILFLFHVAMLNCAHTLGCRSVRQKSKCLFSPGERLRNRRGKLLRAQHLWKWNATALIGTTASGSHDYSRMQRPNVSVLFLVYPLPKIPIPARREDEIKWNFCRHRFASAPRMLATVAIVVVRACVRATLNSKIVRCISKSMNYLGI